MCMQYWPANVGLSDEYEGIRVELKREEQLANFMIRTLILYKEGEVSSISDIYNPNYNIYKL